MHEEVTAPSSRTGHPGEGEETREPRLTAGRNSRRAWVHADLGVLGPKFSSAPVTSAEVPGSPARRQNRMRIKGEGTLGRGGGGGGERCAQRPRSPDEEVCLEPARGASRGAARALPRGGSCTCCSAGEHAASPRRATATRAPGDRTVTRRGGWGAVARTCEDANRGGQRREPLPDGPEGSAARAGAHLYGSGEPEQGTRLLRVSARVQVNFPASERAGPDEVAGATCGDEEILPPGFRSHWFPGLRAEHGQQEEQSRILGDHSVCWWTGCVSWRRRAC